MSSVYLYADPHFGHQGVCRFTRHDGTKLRPFDNADQMDQVLVERWNQTVKPNDKIYVLGDVAMRSKHMHVMSQLHGDKVLIKGNHDIFKMKEYATYFRDIRAYHVMNGCLLSHIPIHPASMGRFGCNIHGHLHYREVTTDQDQIDPRYICVSVEHTNYAPILFEEVCQRIVDRGGQVGFRATGDAAL